MADRGAPVKPKHNHKAAAAPPEMPPVRGPHPFLDSPLEAARAMHDKAVREMDARYGTDVLQTLVSPELAARFARVKLDLAAATEAGDDATAIQKYGSIVRGLTAMEEAALAAGHKPLEIARWWSTRADDGRAYLFTQDEDDARVAARQGRWDGFQIWSLPEVIRVLEDKSFESVLKAKQLWPEAAIVKVVRPAVDWRVGDEVLF